MARRKRGKRTASTHAGEGWRPEWGIRTEGRLWRSLGSHFVKLLLGILQPLFEIGAAFHVGAAFKGLFVQRIEKDSYALHARARIAVERIRRIISDIAPIKVSGS